MKRSFVDTNVLVYAYDADEKPKQARSKELLEQLGKAGKIVLSTQVLQEFYVTVTRKLARPLPMESGLEALEAWAILPVVRIDTELIVEAARLSRQSRISFWDALILRAAVAGGCERVLSEDLQNGFVHEGLHVENPFHSL